jgi:hypothetical protein
MFRLSCLSKHRSGCGASLLTSVLGALPLVLERSQQARFFLFSYCQRLGQWIN